MVRWLKLSRLRPRQRRRSGAAAPSSDVRPARRRGGDPRFARSGDHRIAYTVRTSLFARRRPWLVLIQGLGFDRDGWEPILPRLQRHFRLVLIDNRGSGASDPALVPFDVAQMAHDVVAVLDQAGVAKAHVLGISLGGMIAQEVAAEHPDRVDALVLAATTPGFPHGYPIPAESVSLFATTPFLSSEAKRRRHVENALSAATARNRPELVERLIGHVSARPTRPETISAQAAAGARFVSRHGPQAISARTLILHGDADRVVDPRNGRLLAGRIPDAELRVFPGLGHLLFWEDPDAFVDAVTSFLLPADGGNIRTGQSPANASSSR
jgi:3-oxoadipate enol-lactonase